jgi:hypothetical protein
MTGSGSKDGEVAREIASLAALDRECLVRRWRTTYGTPPPHKLSRAILEKALAYEIQCAAFGGLSTATRRALRTAASSQGKTKGMRPVSRGARLVREWNGVVHEVDVTDEGYIWQDRTFRSLTAIACQITGTKWSGPRFFRLTDLS